LRASASEQRGFTTIQYVVATALSLLLFVLMGNLLVDLYERGAMHDALDEGVHAAVPVDATPTDCETRARDVVRSIAGGGLLHVDALRCTGDATSVVATARVTLRSWLPELVPDWSLDLRAIARRERP
jgi:hypothetical protein